MLSELHNEKTRKLVQANRANFDRNALQRRLKVLEVAVMAAQAETEVLREQLQRIESSTSWRLTRPVRAVKLAVQLWRDAIVRRHTRPPAAASGTDLPHYQAWIRAGEAPCRAALPRPNAEYYPKTIGLALWATAGSGASIAALLADFPPGCTILILDQGAELPPDLPDHVIHHPVAADATPAQSVALALQHLDTDMLGFLDARDRLAPGALALAARAAAQFAPIDLLFADEDWLDADGARTDPFFKPGWDPELQRGRDLIGPFAFFRRELVQRALPVPGLAWLYDLANQVTAAADPDRIHHIAAVLCHRTVLPPGYPAALREAAGAQLARDGIAASVTPHPQNPAWNRVRYALPSPPPLVSIIVPTRDRADLLRACAEGVLKRTDYPALELLIVDNNSVEPATFALFDRLAADPRVRVLRQRGDFNWSALNNVAAQHAAGSILLLLNNDIAMLQPDWLTELVSHAIQPGVGAVGAKLIYPDGRVQHAGLTTNNSGIPRHLFRYLDGNADGAFGLAGLARGVWGVTGACLAIPRAVFDEVGCLNEAFPLAYNDVELCLRLTAHGYRILWTPWARLVHHEMATRPPDHLGGRREQVLEELKWLLRDWGPLIEYDPFFNPNLQVIDEQPHFRKPTGAG